MTFILPNLVYSYFCGIRVNLSFLNNIEIFLFICRMMQQYHSYVLLAAGTLRK